MSRFFRKTFDIDLDHALQYPSVKIICDTISKKEKDIELISTEKQVSFKQDNVLYKVEVAMARGGYILHCKEVED